MDVSPFKTMSCEILHNFCFHRRTKVLVGNIIDYEISIMGHNQIMPHNQIMLQTKVDYGVETFTADGCMGKKSIMFQTTKKSIET